jgi:hypothetical protein
MLSKMKRTPPGREGRSPKCVDSRAALGNPGNIATGPAFQGDDQLVEVIRCNSHREIRVILRGARLLVLEQWAQADERGRFERRGSIPIRVDLLADVIGAMASARTRLLKDREGDR